MRKTRVGALRFDSSQRLKRHSIFLPMIGVLGWGRAGQHTAGNPLRATTGEADMARFEMVDVERVALGAGASTADAFFYLGMMYSIGRSVPVDLVAAHKWFNLAAMRGNADASRLRREIADQMSALDIAAALRAARAWLNAH
jgi:hypothetical protein